MKALCSYSSTCMVQGLICQPAVQDGLKNTTPRPTYTHTHHLHRALREQRFQSQQVNSWCEDNPQGEVVKALLQKQPQSVGAFLSLIGDLEL